MVPVEGEPSREGLNESPIPVPTFNGDESKMPAKKTAEAPVPTTVVAESNGSNGEVKQRKPRTPLPAGAGVATGQLSFAAAPPTVSRGRSGSTAYNAVLEQLKANAGQWALIGHFTSGGNRPSALKNAGCEFRAVRAKNGDGTPATFETGDPMFELWASYPAN